MPPIKFAFSESSSKQDAGGFPLEKFQLYETRQRFYLMGSDKHKKNWRVLKIDRSEPFELNISEDPVTYTQQEYNDLLQRIADGNRATGGLNLVTKAFGIAGCVKFLRSYYLMLITKRRQIGSICDHAIYGIEECEIFTVPHSSMLSELAPSKAEQRYKKLLSSVDLTKDFFFSYDYPIMQSLQKNMLMGDAEPMPYDNMFVWNAYLTQSIRQRLNNNRWTIALVHGSFEQVKTSFFGRVFDIILIARRSRHFAGTRYLKRGVNDKGRVANDVETEQIITKEEPGLLHWEVTSVVQVRGSIPLFWSQEASRLSPKPDIILQRYDPTYQATKLHFEDLVKRYGNPIVILSLIKTVEKRPREMVLRREFTNAVSYLNQMRPPESQLQFIHWDLQKFAKSKSRNVLPILGGVASRALDLTGIYYSGRGSFVKFHLEQSNLIPSSGRRDDTLRQVSPLKGDDCSLGELSRHVAGEDLHSDKVSQQLLEGKAGTDEKERMRLPTYQTGVLRTNCIDCLDRTNVGQYAYGLAAMGRQLFALGLTDKMKVDPDSSIAGALMDMYQNMGDALSLQYGGSAAHNSVFPERHGKWKATTQAQEFIKSIKRYYNNTYTDGEKQDAINLFLGYFQPQESKPDLWELDSDCYLHAGGNGDNSSGCDAWSSQEGSNNVMMLKRRISVLSTCMGDLGHVKLTSFDKLIKATCGPIKNVRMCSELDAKRKHAPHLSGPAPDPIEIQLQSPTWLYGEHKQQEARPDKTHVRGISPKEKKGSEHNQLLVLDNSYELEAFERYIRMAEIENDSWYGSCLPGVVEDSEANKHYAQFFQDACLDPFKSSEEVDDIFKYSHSADARIHEIDDVAVMLSMESALKEYKDIGKDLGKIIFESCPKENQNLAQLFLGEDELCVQDDFQ